MFKSLILVFFLVNSFSALAKIEVRWLGVAGLIIEDDETKIMFDPMVTRPTWKHWLMINKFKSDASLVDQMVKELQISDLKAIFSSHSHFDHVVDAPIFSKYTGAFFYVDDSSEIIANAYKDEMIRTKKIMETHSIQLGKFKVTPIKRHHPKIHTFGIEWLPGPVKSNFDFGFYDYHLGDAWMYLIEHPQGTILIDQGAESRVDLLTKYTKHIDVLFQGVANRQNDETFLNGYITIFRPKFFMPLHFDNFFTKLNKKTTSDLPGIKLSNLLETIRKDQPEMKVIKPNFAERYTVFE